MENTVDELECFLYLEGWLFLNDYSFFNIHFCKKKPKRYLNLYKTYTAPMLYRKMQQIINEYLKTSWHSWNKVKSPRN